MIFQINIVIAIVIKDSLYLVWDSTMRAFHHTPEFQSIIMKLSKIPLDSITPDLEFQWTSKLWVPLTRNSTGLQNSTPGIPLDSEFRVPLTGIPPDSRTPHLAFQRTPQFPGSAYPEFHWTPELHTWHSAGPGIPPEFRVYFY